VRAPEGRPARIAAGIGATRGKRIEPLLCVIPGSVPLLEGRGVRGGLTGGPTELGQVHGAERGRGAAERSRRRSARGKREDGDDKRARLAARATGCGRRCWAERAEGESWAAALAKRGCGMGLGRWLAGPSARKRRRRWAAGKRREWVGPEGFPGWATRLIWFFLFSFLLPFSNQLKSN